MANSDPIITNFVIKNFRCFSQYTINFDHGIALIEGCNGVGKTSLLEALYYSCYLRSFRTHAPRELIQFGYDNFFIKTEVKAADTGLSHSLHIGFSPSKRLVKVDDKVVHSFKDLMYLYKIVSLTEDDLDLIKGSPSMRRSFMDQALILKDPSFATVLRTHRHIVDQRNALLNARSIDQDTYTILSKQLWESSMQIAAQRLAFLQELKQEVAPLLEQLTIKGTLSLSYLPKREYGQSFIAFQDAYPELAQQEYRFKRTLFGAHLDDIQILFYEKKSRTYASRGQQKMIVLLLKMAQSMLLSHEKTPLIFLLDDFMTDFDEKRSEQLIELMTTIEAHLLFSSPIKGGPLNRFFASRNIDHVKLTY